MVKLVWTELLTEDLKEIFDYISKDSFRYASITVNKIYNRAQDIIDNPYVGRIAMGQGSSTVVRLFFVKMPRNSCSHFFSGSPRVSEIKT